MKTTVLILILLTATLARAGDMPTESYETSNLWTDKQVLRVLNDDISETKLSYPRRGDRECSGPDPRAPGKRLTFEIRPSFPPPHDMGAITSDGKDVYPIFEDEPAEYKDLQPEKFTWAKITSQTCEDLSYDAVTVRRLRIVLDDQLIVIEGTFQCKERGWIRKGASYVDGRCQTYND